MSTRIDRNHAFLLRQQSTIEELRRALVTIRALAREATCRKHDATLQRIYEVARDACPPD